MNILNYLKAVLGAVAASLYPLVDWLVGMIPNIPAMPRTILDMVIMALLTGGTVAAATNRNQANLTTGQVVVKQAAIPPGTPVVQAVKP